MPKVYLKEYSLSPLNKWPDHLLIRLANQMEQKNKILLVPGNGTIKPWNIDQELEKRFLDVAADITETPKIPIARLKPL